MTLARFCAVLVLFVAVLGDSATNAALAQATLSASPNPCVVPAGQTLCTTQISWSGAPDNAQIWVTIIQTGQVALMAAGPSGSVSVPWIQFGRSYRFDLWAVRNGGFGQSRALIATRTVSARY